MSQLLSDSDSEGLSLIDNEDEDWYPASIPDFDDSDDSDIEVNGQLDEESSDDYIVQEQDEDAQPWGLVNNSGESEAQYVAKGIFIF